MDKAQHNDGRVGTAYIQELRFNKYCERLQNPVSNEFNQEFKQYLIEKGVNIDVAMFQILSSHHNELCILQTGRSR